MRRRFLLSVLATDLAALAVAFSIASLTVFGAMPWNARLPASAQSSIWPFAGLLTLGVLFGVLLGFRMWGVSTPRPSYGRALAAAAFTLAFTAMGIVLFRPYHSNGVLGITLGAWLLLALGHRAVRRRRPWTERMIVVTNEKGLVDDLRLSEHADVVEVYDPTDGAPEGVDFNNMLLVVDLRPVMSDKMAQFVSSWNLAGYPIRSLTAVYEEHTGRLPVVHLAEGWELSTPMGRNVFAPFKRVIEILLVMVTAPVWLLVVAVSWPLIAIDSRGPVLYRQERVGLGGRTFELYKFRTMVVDAEAEGPRFASRGDVRMTRVGRLLRRFRIDEIPQLWNVLKGDLSLVGPRPERPVFTRRFELTIPFYRYRHLVRPGLTGWAQVNFGYADDEAQTVEKLTYDLYYIKHMSPWLDLQIMGKSLWTVLSGFGAK
jgi:exopolysaccharide biosynthesis polyprenyl glycosylphosphotransferase